mmetsp:Transcript_21499/g.46715  ORF Transcript_21499/g.46715 Transcript_21499/m.46715 type:complete len:346 (+) Transcript_21499:260-1297(+)|eukprot:CAMPEP_0172305644 /NCGR_PEP_ID=MMETSP1058-20130122/6900_1 /TAXON_ID=83371 /ORGANISM="Detonula confervacea, Strain CCMP 353" /LENGTH=345 /DNA_ID=CAMNT_0013017313 /DNA_START=200 /DNA_END=1237 /DNA_ORIENTATION=+
MTPPATTTQTPLLSAIDMEAPVKEPASKNNSTPNNNEQELQFYDPTVVLDICREVAFGYLILLTGGAVEYEPPTLEDASSLKKQPPQDGSQPPAQSQDQTTKQANKSQAQSSGKLVSTPTLDAESASLAYAAIVDGNVLHACFGLKATANGRVGNDTNIPIIGDKNKQSSLFCCFPSSSAALQLVLPHAAKNKLKMQNLMEMLREVRDLHYEALESSVAAASGTSKVPLYMQAIHAYIHCFTAIVRYHDTKKSLKSESTTNNKEKQSKPDGIIVCCANLLNKLNLFSKPKDNTQLEQLQNDTLQDIEHGFRGLKEDIWESLEKMATETAFTGVSVEESTFEEREE